MAWIHSQITRRIKASVLRGRERFIKQAFKCFLRLRPHHRECTGSQSDHRSQVLSGGVSTWLGDRLGIPRVVDFLDIYFGVISHFLVSLLFWFFCCCCCCSALQRRKRVKDGGYRRLLLECQVLVGFLLPRDIFMRRNMFWPRLTIDRG